MSYTRFPSGKMVPVFPPSLICVAWMHLVVTYCDEAKGEWHMLMPKELRESLAADLPFFLDCAARGVKALSAKELRMMAAVRDFFGGQ